MSSARYATRLRARLLRTPMALPATNRELALQVVDRVPGDSVAWGALASALVDLGLFARARTALGRFEKTWSGSKYQVYSRRGSFHRSRGELTSAEKWYRKAAAADAAGLVFLGAVLARQGRFAEAKACHRRATRAPANDLLARDEAHFNLGLILRAERRYRQALACFDRAIVLDPGYADARAAHADVRLAMMVKVPEDPSTHWREMLDAMRPTPAVSHELARAFTTRHPAKSGGWIVLADILSGFARYDEAATLLRKGVAVAKSETWKEPPDAFFASQWGELYRQKKDFMRAERSFRRAVALQPTPRHLTHLAEVLVMQGRFAPAKRLLQRALRDESTDPSNTHYQLGLIARAHRAYADAREHFEAAIRHSPDFPLAHVARQDVRSAVKASRGA